MTPKFFVESSICLLWWNLMCSGKSTRLGVCVLPWTSLTHCVSLGKTLYLSEPQGHRHLQNELKNTCPATSQDSTGWDKVWERALKVKYYIVMVLFFWLFCLPTGKISSKVHFYDEAGEKEDPSKVPWSQESLTKQFSSQSRRAIEKETGDAEEGGGAGLYHRGPTGSPERGWACVGGLGGRRLGSSWWSVRERVLLGL